VDRISNGFNVNPDPSFYLSADADRQIHADPDTDFALKVLSSHLNWGARLDSFDPL
jgi:hypothetical protein